VDIIGLSSGASSSRKRNIVVKVSFESKKRSGCKVIFKDKTINLVLELLAEKIHP
jgi:hypothetical protein